MKKLKILILTLLFSLVLVACNNNNNDELPEEPELPTEILEVSKDEMIYVNLLESGEVSSMQASNKISDTTFAYYKEYGDFNESNHLHITSGDSEILIEDDYALIPSLKDYNSLNYILSLKTAGYQNSLPFKLEFKYKLNGNTVSYNTLKNASGEVEIIIEVNANSQAQSYFKDNYAAQIQVPINTSYNKVIDSGKTMSKMMVGQTLNLIYMVMPNTSETISITLSSTNFSFSGIEATYSPFNIDDMMDSFLDFDLDGLGLGAISDVGDGLDLILNEFNNAKVMTDQLFDSISMFEQLVGNNQLNELDVLITELNSFTFRTGINLPSNSIKYTGIENREQYVSKYQNFSNLIIATIHDLTDHHTVLITSLDALKDSINDLTKYPNIYKNFVEIIDHLNDIKLAFNVINDLGPLTIDLIVENKTIINEQFTIIGQLNNLIKSKFQTLIKGMIFLPSDLEGLANNIELVTDLVNAFTGFVNEVLKLHNYLVDFTTNLEQDLALDVFNILSKGLIEDLYQQLVAGSGDNPGLIPALELIGMLIGSVDFGDINEINQLKDLYIKENGIRPIDQLVLGFVQMNEALALPQVGLDYSFYDSLSMLNMVTMIFDLIPKSNNSEESVVSFLSLDNEPPNFIQFVIKQNGF